MGDKLKKDFRKANLARAKLNQAEEELLVFEELYKNNDIIKEYKKLLDNKTKCTEKMKEASAYLYEDMLEEDIDFLEGKYIDVTLKRPYYKTVFDLEQFKDDYSEKSKMYKKYVSKTLVKGNVNIKPVKVTTVKK